VTFAELASGAAGAVIGALLSAIALMHQTQSQIAAQHVVGERAKWREKIRDAAAKALADKSPASFDEFWLTLKLNTNPFSNEDIDLVEKAAALRNGNATVEDWDEMSDRLARLLKHDWERAKFETRWYRLMWFSPERTKYVKPHAPKE
jgi:hypothetical protein